MGGSQSADVNAGVSSSSISSSVPVFTYNCNAEVADFINNNPQYFRELTKTVGNYADVPSISSNNGTQGEVQLRSKLNASSSSDISGCKQKLDDFFDGFLSFEEKLDKIIPRQTLDHILNSQGSRCATTENAFKNTITITGRSADVKKIVKSLRDAQFSPPPAPRTPTPPPRQVPSISARSTVSLPGTGQPASPSGLSPTHSASYSSSDHVSPAFAASAFDSSQASSSSLSTTYTLPQGVQRISIQPAASSSSNLVCSSSPPRNVHQQMKKPVPVPRNSSMLSPLSTFLVFNHPAEDFAVARFIKYSHEHTLLLESALAQLASVTVNNQTRGEKKVEYEFRPVPNLKITEETFEETCKKCLFEFLKEYDSRKRRFNHEHLQKVRDKAPDFFRKKSMDENDGVHVLWHVDDSLLIMAGLKDDVTKKEKEITDFLYQTVPRYVSSRFVFKLKAQDYSVARFLKQSPVNMMQLESELRDTATVKVWICNDRGENEKVIEYQCRPLPELELTDAKFKSQCRSVLLKFLENYSSVKKFFNHDHLMRVVSREPDFFTKRTAQENQDLFLEWHLDENKLRIAGPKLDVEAKLQEITQFLDSAAPKKRLVSPRFIFKWETQDLSVARFLKQSSGHMAKLSDLLQDVATVRICISNAKDKDNEAEYHLKPIPGLELTEVEYKSTCRNILSKFLQEYDATKRFFNHDRLMKSVLNAPDFFKQQTPQENQELYVQWQVDKNSVRITGPKVAVNAKVQAINQFLDATVPRILRNAYEFYMPGPKIQIAKFIKQSETHNEALKEAIRDAKVWITPDKSSLHFKATVELSQIDIPKFENNCKTAAVRFFNKYDMWHQTHSKAVVETLRNSHSRWFDNENDWKLEIINGNDITLVGLMPLFMKKRTELLALLKKINSQIRNQSPKHNASNQPHEPGPSIPQPTTFQPYIYQPKASANKTIIKHIFQSPVDMRGLQHGLGVFIMFEVFPNADEPEGIKFYPVAGALIDPRYYSHDVPEIIKGFLSRFSTSRKKCSEREKRQVLDAVYGIGQKHCVAERMISLHRQGEYLNIAGPRNVILEISHCIGGVNCDGELSISLRLMPAPNTPTRRPENSRPGRKSSSSSVTDGAPKRKPRSRSTTPKPTTPKPTTPKPTTPKTATPNPTTPKKVPDKRLTTVVYGPKKAFLAMFKFVLSEQRFYKELKTRLSDLCVLTETSGVTDQLKVAPKNPEIVDPSLFSKKVVEEMEKFLTSIAIVTIEVDDELVQFFEQSNNDWLKNFYNAEDWVVLSVEEKSIEIKGFKDDVTKCETAIKEQIKEATITREITPELCRVMSICGVLAETNRQLGGKATITCSVDDGTVSCTGKQCYLDYAMQKLGEVAHLEEEPPMVSEEKIKALEKLLTNQNQKFNQELIQKKFAEKKIKCVLVFQADKVILTAMTKEMYRKGSKYIDELLQVMDIPTSDSLPKDLFTQPKWKVLVAQIASAKPVFVQIQDTCVKLIGLDQSDLKEAKDKICQFLLKKLISTRHIQCKEHSSKFILKHLVPPPLKVSTSPQGLVITGNTDEVDKFVESLKGNVKSEKLSFAAPELSTHISSDQWQGFVKLLEHDLRCTIWCDEARSRQQPLQEEEETIASPSASNRGAFKNDLAKEARYGSVSVSVCHGDVTVEIVDVIINGVMDRDFDLSRGTVSSALLKRAGSKMQEECKGADKSSSTMRCTRGWNLLCDRVIHMVTPHQADKLTERIKKALDHAELLKATSVSLPTLGAGGIGINAVAVASAISKAFELFARENPRYVKSIRLIVFEQPLVDLFQTSIVQAKETMGFGKRAVELAEAKVASLQDDDVVVLICSDDSKCLASAKEKIENHMSTVIVVEKMKVDILSELEDNDRLDIFEAAVKHRASVAFNYTALEIVLTGLSNNVSKLHADIRELLFELREATTISKMIVWKWAGTSNIYNALPLRVSRAIEKEYEKTKSGVTSVTLYGSPMVVNFSSETYDFKMINGTLKREDSDKIPSDWEDILGKHWMKVSLDRNSAEYKRVLQLFKSSSPTHSHVVSIERVQNPSLFKQYLIKKSEVERHMITNHSAERELFHGTSQLDADKICADGFDRNFAGKNATVYGKGCYFAVNSSYSVGYTGSTSVGVKCVFLARVLTGDFCKGHHNMVAPPEKPYSGDTVRKYDSVVDNENSPTIFVVFKDSSVYPYYLISFC